MGAPGRRLSPDRHSAREENQDHDDDRDCRGGLGCPNHLMPDGNPSLACGHEARTAR